MFYLHVERNDFIAIKSCHNWQNWDIILQDVRDMTFWSRSFLEICNIFGKKSLRRFGGIRNDQKVIDHGITFTGRRLPVSDTSKHRHGASCLLVCFKFSSLIFHTFTLPTPPTPSHRRFLSILKEHERKRRERESMRKRENRNWNVAKREERKEAEDRTRRDNRSLLHALFK